MRSSSNLKKIYGISATYSIFFTPIYVAYMRHLGFSYVEISILHTVKDICAFTFEVPSGVLADMTSRKVSLAISALSTLLAAMLFATGESFLHFLFAFALWGISYAFVSGTDEAIAYESVTRKASYGRVISNMSLTRKVSAFFANVVGPILYVIDAAFPFIASAFSSGVTCVLALSLKDTRRRSQNRQGFADYLREAWATLKTGGLFQLTWVYGLLLGTMFCLFVLQQPLLLQAGFKPISFSWALGLVFLFSALSSFAARFLKREHLFPQIQIICSVTLIASSAAMALSINPVVVLGMMIVQTSVYSVVFQIRSMQVNHLATDANRSGILSAQSLVVNVVKAVLILLAEMVADFVSLNTAVFFLGSIPLISLYFALRKWRTGPSMPLDEPGPFAD